jgi:glucose-6-phosphate 1-epimerase
LSSSSEFADLDRRFGIPAIASVVAGHGGLPKVVVSSPVAAGEMYLHGGHVTSWTPKGRSDVLYCSPNTIWQDGRAIRGGVPVCFPWFGDNANDPSAPTHGFVRTKPWQLDSIDVFGDEVTVSMSTHSADDTLSWWPFDFRLVNRATFGTRLKLELTVVNTGASPFTYEEALHAYFRVGDPQAAIIRGLDHVRYIDRVNHLVEKTQSGDVRLSSETDRIYLNTSHPIDIDDSVLDRRLTIQKENSLTTVVWNPWADKSAKIADLGAGEWKNFVCVEASNVGAFAVHLAPGQSHTMAAHVNCE